MDRLIKFHEDPIFYDVINNENIKSLKNQLQSHSNIYEMNYAILYHGTSRKNPVLEQGLLPTSNNRKKSLQSTNGYVYLSIFPSMAKNFGEIAYPNQDISVYEVKVLMKNLIADTDQLRNKRMWGNVVCGNSLAESLLIGHGARVKGKIDLWQIKEYQQ